LTSCSKFEGDQTVPAFIRVDSIGLKITSIDQGSKSAYISDAWIFVDDELIGAFELPCLVPVLYQGNHSVTVKPGIRLNGLINLRSAFPLFTSITQNLRLIPDSVTVVKGSVINGKVTPMVQYAETTTIEVTEAFEDAFYVFDTTTNSQLDMSLTPSGTPFTFEGDHSGMVTLSDTLTYFEMYTDEKYTLPRQSTPVFLEMDYMTSIPITIGVYSYSSSEIIQHPVLVLTDMPKWQKVYVNLTPIVSSQTSATSFRIFIGANRLESDPAGTVYLDNIKLIHQ
ncbi:MAG: hypothetical protein CVU06_07770, partial [Bacteroidetes bacterium HGW-Bacteroidetes-22]